MYCMQRKLTPALSKVWFLKKHNFLKGFLDVFRNCTLERSEVICVSSSASGLGGKVEALEVL